MKRFEKVGFMKPVGQKFLVVNDDSADGTTTTSLQIDKDAVLVKEHFQLNHVPYRDINPVLIPKGYTRDYLDGKITLDMQKQRIMESFQRIREQSDVILCEGTGHTAVGSVVDVSNAEVAAMLNARMVLVVNGGIGKALDELEINKVFCDKFGVEIAGVIVNRVEPEKYDQVKHYLGKALRNKWNVPLIGLVPDRPFLGCPAIADMERLFEGSKLVSGKEFRMRHYTVQELQLVATSLEVFLKNLRRDPERTLYVSHASRNDILLGFLIESQQRGPQWEAAMIVTGTNDYPISQQVMEIVSSMKDAPPVLMVPKQTHHVMEAIHRFTPKLHSEDANRVSVAVNHYEPYIDFDLLLEEDTTADSSVASVP
jgi:BioD-like phosphotransacetylase family protein